MRIWPALAADVICILVFAIVGRRSHAEGTDLVGVLQTAWPFLAGYVVGLALGRCWRQPMARSSVLVLWLSTVVVAMLLRTVTGAGTPWPFVVATTVMLGLLLLGWRGLHRLVVRARHRSSQSATI